MKVTIDTDDWWRESIIFETQEEWDEHVKALYEYAPRHRPDDKPDRFPCLAINGGTWDNPNGPIEVTYLFFYDFEINDGAANETV